MKEIRGKEKGENRKKEKRMKGDKKKGWKEVRREERNLCARKRYRQKEEN